jgi:phosphate acetyltransferase
MNLIESLRNKASARNLSVVLPESEDMRTIRAASFMAKESICRPILLGNRERIEQLCHEAGFTVDNAVSIVDPLNSSHSQMFAQYLFEKRKAIGLTLEQSTELMSNKLFYAASMLRHQLVDACVAGAVNTTGDVLRAAIQVVGLRPGSSVVSSIFLMNLPDGRVLTFGDCAVVPYPDSDQLATIAVDSSVTHQKLTGEDARTAMLSFSTMGSARHDRTALVIEAASKARKLNPELRIEGEMQFDAAFLPEIGSKKAPGSTVAGQANVFIFPNLDAGNIGYKIAERLGGATAIGPIIQGLDKPMNDLSRGCSWEDIVNTAAVSVLQA